jgi:uncharacterized protein involved in exopolysaccharide biosynthesis
MVMRATMASLLVAVAVGVASLLQTPKYEASAQGWVDQEQGDQQNSTDPVQAKQIANTIGKVSSELISERSVAGSKLRARTVARTSLSDCFVRRSTTMDLSGASEICHQRVR